MRINYEKITKQSRTNYENSSKNSDFVEIIKKRLLISNITYNFCFITFSENFCDVFLYISKQCFFFLNFVGELARRFNMTGIEMESKDNVL